MRSWPSIVIAVAVAACGTDAVPRDDMGDGSDDMHVDPSACETSYLDYDNFGAPFVINWCRGCHSSAVPEAMRQKAPVSVNFDSQADVQMWSPKIMTKTTGAAPSMPPAGGPSEDERALLAEWVACGAK